MTGVTRRVTAGTVGRRHGLDGSFYVEAPAHALPLGTEVHVAGARREVERRGGTETRPLVRLSGVSSPEAASDLQGELLLVDEQLAADEWLADDLIGCRVEGLGSVRRVLPAPSCAVLELEDGTLVPFVSDAIRAVRPDAGVIEADLEFLGLDSDAP